MAASVGGGAQEVGARPKLTKSSRTPATAASCSRAAPFALGVCTGRSSPEGHGEADGTRAYAVGEARAVGVALSQTGCRAGVMAVTQWRARRPPHRWAQRGRWRRHQLNRDDQHIGGLACVRQAHFLRKLPQARPRQLLPRGACAEQMSRRHGASAAGGKGRRPPFERDVGCARDAASQLFHRGEQSDACHARCNYHLQHSATQREAASCNVVK